MRTTHGKLSVRLSDSLLAVQQQSNYNKKVFFLYRSVVNGIMAQVASNLKTTVDVTDLAFRTGSHIQLTIFLRGLQRDVVYLG